MRNKNKRLASILIFTSLFNIFGATAGPGNPVQIKDMEKFRNDKEVVSSTYSKRELNKVLKKIPYEQFTYLALKGIDQSLIDFLEIAPPNYCDMAMSATLIANFSNVNFQLSELDTYIKLARAHNSIDDIMAEILSNIVEDDKRLKRAEENTFIPTGSKTYTRVKATSGPRKHTVYTSDNDIVRQNDLSNLYHDFKTWPDEISTCSNIAYHNFKAHIKADRHVGENDILALHTEAYLNGHITLSTFHKLKIMDELKSSKYPLSLTSYIKTIQKSKNTLVPDNKKEETSLEALEGQYNFAGEVINKDTNLTRRKALLYKYDETQIIILANILKKAARRMGTDPDYNLSMAKLTLSFEYEGDNQERENYVEEYELSMQDQYTFARNLLNKDIKAVERSERFKGYHISYSEIVMAALETGYISHEDIQHVMKYDDIFNTNELSSWRKFERYVLRVFNMSTIYLTPPWNIVGAVAMVVIEDQLTKRRKDGANHENEAAIIR